MQKQTNKSDTNLTSLFLSLYGYQIYCLTMPESTSNHRETQPLDVPRYRDQNRKVGRAGRINVSSPGATRQRSSACFFILLWFKGTVSDILSDLHAKMAIPDSQRYPSKLCLIKYELDYFQLWLFIYKSDLRISTAKQIETIRIKHF